MATQSSLVKTILHNSIAEGIYDEIVNRSARYYYFLGKTLSWEDEFTPPAPIDSFDYELKTRNEAITLKEIKPTDISFVVTRYNWTSGSVYDMYDDQYSKEVQGIDLINGGAGYTAAPTVYIGSAGSVTWTANTAVLAGAFLKISNRYYIVTTAGTTGTVAPTHTSGAASNGTASLTYTRIYGAAFDGTYTGVATRQFYASTIQDIGNSDNVCIIKVELDALTKYPGYYQNNDGFLDDAIFIQDSKYYQAYSYVLKINEKLESYKSAVKTLVHPSGMALFGEYDIKNEFDLGSSLEFLMKIISLFEQDEVFSSDGVSTKHVGKPLGSQLDYSGNAEDTKVVLSEFDTKLVTKGNFPETLIASNTGNIFWQHTDISSGAIQNFTIPIIDVTAWDKYTDSVVLSDSDDLNINKNLTENVSIAESLSIGIVKPIADFQSVLDFTTYTQYFGVGNENLEYFDSNYAEQTPTITVSLL